MKSESGIILVHKMTKFSGTYQRITPVKCKINGALILYRKMRVSCMITTIDKIVQVVSKNYINEDVCMNVNVISK